MNTHPLPETSSSSNDYFNLKISSSYTKQTTLQMEQDTELKIKYTIKLVNKGKPDFYKISTTPDEFSQILQKQIDDIPSKYTVMEVMFPHDIVKPYFDIDIKYDPNFKQTDDGFGFCKFNDLQQYREREQFILNYENVLQIIQNVFPDENISLDNLVIFKSTQTQKYYEYKKENPQDTTEKNGLHIYIKGFCITPYNLGKYIKQYNNGRHIIDESIYPCQKTPIDKVSRLRCPMVRWDWRQKYNIYKLDNSTTGYIRGNNKTDWIIQYTDKNDILIQGLKETDITTSSKGFIPPKKQELKCNVINYTIPLDVIETILDQTRPLHDKPLLRDCIWSLLCNEVPIDWIYRWLNQNETGSNTIKLFTLDDDLTSYFHKYDTWNYSLGTFLKNVLLRQNEELYNEIVTEYGNPQYKQFKKNIETLYTKLRDIGRFWKHDTQQIITEETLIKGWKEHTYITNRGFKKSYITDWLLDDNMSVKLDVVFKPPPILEDNINFEDYINSYIPPILPDYPEGVELKHNYTELLRHLCNRDEKCFDFCMRYIYHLVKFPSIIPSVGICFQSIPGTGKNLFWQLFLGSIIGEKYISITTDIDEIFGRFSNFRENNLISIFEESHTSKKNQEKLKSSITNQSGTLEEKGIQRKKVKFYDRWIFLSNNDFPVSIGDHDRRLVLIETTNVQYKYDWTGDDGMFSYLNSKGLTNPQEIWGFLEDLEQYPVDMYYDFKNNRPLTAAYEDNIRVQNKHPIDQFLERLIEYDIKQCEICKRKFKTYTNVDGDFKEGFTLYDLHDMFKVKIPNYQIDFPKFQHYVSRKCKNKLVFERLGKEKKYMYLLDDRIQQQELICSNKKRKQNIFNQ